MADLKKDPAKPTKGRATTGPCIPGLLRRKGPGHTGGS
jgi:hypothetical protein